MTTGRAPLASPHSARILVVDDELSIRRLVTRVLSAAGYDVSLADNGADALQILTAAGAEGGAAAIDLVLLDVNMPGEDGFSVCRRLRQDLTAAPPVIFVTAQGGVDDRVVGLDSGAVDYVCKPFDTKELLARVRAALRTKRQQDALAVAADTDGLTGLLSRRALDARATELFALAQRHDRPLACLMIDVDHFKRVNDTHGHAAGDAVLRAVAERLRAASRVHDVLGRYGGEEFAALLPETGLDGALRAAEKLRASIAASPVAGGEAEVGIPVTASLGVAARAPDTTTVGALFAAADAALYDAKRTGRNRVVASSPGAHTNRSEGESA